MVLTHITCNIHSILLLVTSSLQWRRQDLLRGGAKLEIRSWGNQGELQGRVSSMTNSFVTIAALIERAVSC